MMAVECGVITSILIIMAIVFFKNKHKSWGLATLPLTLLPVTDFVMEVLFVKVFDMSISVYWGIFALVAAVAVSCAWIGFAASALKAKKTKLSYVIIANLFNVLLAAILIYNILSQLSVFDLYDL